LRLYGFFVKTIPPLILQLSSSNDQILAPVLGLLSGIAQKSPVGRESIITEGGWNPLLGLLSSSNGEVVEATTRMITLLQRIDSRVIKLLSNHLTSPDNNVAEAAALCISDIGLGSPCFFEGTTTMRSLVALLSSSSEGVQVGSVSAITNLTYQSDLMRNAFAQEDVAFPLLRLLSSSNSLIREYALFATLNITSRYGPSRKFRKAGAAALLKALAQSETGSTRNDATRAASNVGWCGPSRLIWVIDHESDLTLIAGSSTSPCAFL
jgi:hypothetical protein